MTPQEKTLAEISDEHLIQMMNCKVGKSWRFEKILYMPTINFFVIYFTFGTNVRSGEISYEMAHRIIKDHGMVYRQASNYDWGDYVLSYPHHPKSKPTK